MSKVDDLRALREAKYARAAAYGAQNPKKQPAAPAGAAAAPAPAPAAKKPKASAATKVTASAAETAAAPAATGECGHRNMMGRACTREPGHAAKSHRYS